MNLTANPVIAANSTVETDTWDTFLQEAETYTTYIIARYIAYYWFLVLIPLGLVGNILSFLVMMKPNNTKVSTGIYMAAISLSDNLMICLVIHDYCISVMNTHGWYVLECKTAVYFTFFTLQCATYQIDKFVAIKWPYRSAIYSTPRKAKMIIVTIIICVAIYNLPHFFITTVVAGNCYGHSAKSIATKIYSWFTIVVNGIIPFTLLSHMNYGIVKTVRKSNRMFSSNVGSATIGARQKTMKSAQNQLTTMLLLVTTLYLILLLPTYIRFIYAAFVILDTPSKYAISLFFIEFSYKLYATNSGINFFCIVSVDGNLGMI